MTAMPTDISPGAPPSAAPSPPAAGATPATPATPSSNGHRHDIQGLRALAVLLVVAFHADLHLRGGYVGVDVFFVISGFVIAQMLQREIDRTGSVDLARFYLRRFRRLLPALALLLVSVLLLSSLVTPFALQPVAAGTGVAGALFSSNFYLFSRAQVGYFDVAATANPLLHIWSLSVEEQFYFVFPTLLFLVARATRKRPERRRAAMIGVVGLVVASSFALAWWMVEGHGVPGVATRTRDFAFYSSITRAWEFGAGALLAVLAISRKKLPTAAGVAAGALGMGLIGYAAVRFDATTVFPGPAALVPLAGALLLVIAGTDERGPVHRIFAVKPLTFLGDLSYAWYLWHWPAIVLGGALLPGRSWVAPLFGFASLLPAWLSFRFVENPIRFAVRPTRSTLRLAGICLLLPIVSAGTLTVAHRRLAGSKADLTVGDVFAFHADFMNGCDLQWPRPQLKGDNCTWTPTGGAASGRRPVLLVGDSNAGHFTEPFVAAANAAGLAARVQTNSGCPFAASDLYRDGKLDPNCHAGTLLRLQEIRTLRPSIVVVSDAVDEYLSDERVVLADHDSGARAVTPAQKAALLRRSLAEAVAQIRATGAKVVLVQPIPKFVADWDARTCSTLWHLVDQARCAVSKPRAQVERERKAPTDLIREVAGSDANVVDPIDEICTATRCSTLRGDLWLWKDANHLSVEGAKTLTPFFGALLRPATS